jgi:hypothetical protein
VQAEFQPPNTDPLAANAVSCTEPPGAKYAWQLELPDGIWQLIPGGVLVTVPFPVVFPDRLTLSDGLMV